MSKISQLATELSKELDKRSKTKTELDEQEQGALLALVNTMDDAGMVELEDPLEEDDDLDEDTDTDDPDFGEDEDED
jgi:helix-turn-helix protein